MPAEYRECLLKATPLIEALDATLREEAGSPASGRVAVPPSLRPRPALGAFTSLRVTDGHGHDLDKHLARLDASTRQLFGKHLPPACPATWAAVWPGRPPAGSGSRPGRSAARFRSASR